MASNKKQQPSWLKSFAFGGDAARSMIALVALNAIALLAITAAIFSAVFSLLVLVFVGGYQWQVFYKTLTALFWRYTPFLNHNRPLDFRNLDGQLIDNVTSSALVKYVFETPELASKFMYVMVVGVAAIAISLVAAYYLARYFKEKGERDQRDEFLRGQKLVSTEDLTQMVTKPTEYIYKYNGDPSPISLGGVPVPMKKLARNIGICGSMGSAKTVTLLQIIEDARKWKKKMVIYDPYGEFAEMFYRPGVDVILNPVDARSEDWSIYAELRKVTDPAMISGYFVTSKSGDNDSEFKEAAKILIEDLFIIVRKMGGTMADVRNIATQTPLKKLYKLLKDNNANSCGTINPDNPKTSESVRFSLVAQEAIRFFSFYDKMNATFSVRDFIRRDDDACLFLTSNKTMHNVCRPFISAWIELAYIEAMSMERARGAKMFFIIDELASLQKLNILTLALTEARKFGVVTVIGVNGLALLDEIYGPNWAQAMIANMGNLCVLRTAESKSAEWLADILGKEELEEVSESTSLGVDGGRDGFSLSKKRSEYHIVNYTQIMNVEDGHGWVKLAGAFPVANMVVDWKERPKVAEDFVERPGLVLTTPTPTAMDRAYLDKITAPIPDGEDDDDDGVTDTTAPASAATSAPAAPSKSTSDSPFDGVVI